MTAKQPDHGPAPEPNWQTIGIDIRRISTRALRVPPDWLEDAVQDAVVCIVGLVRAGQRIEDFVAFGAAFVRKRWVDELRNRPYRCQPLDPATGDQQARDKLDTPDWSAWLREAGWKPTETWSRILDAITSGSAGTNKIAEVLGLHRKTISESRKRLRRWLREKVDPPPAS